MSKIKAVFIVGPTASGKTALGIEIAKRFGGEIVSADSMQIYKGIHIASAAPDQDEMCGIKHHLIEFLDRDCQYSVAEYVKAAKECIKDIASRGKLPIVVGGTGLYINSLLDNTEYIEEQTDYDLRNELEKKFDNIGAEEMLRELAEFDRETAARLHTNDRRRIIRAFEVYLTSGKTLTEQNELSHANESDLDPLVIGITFNDRELLYERINKRVEIMLGKGLLEEAKEAFTLSGGNAANQAIGHKELFGYLNGECSLEESAELLKRQTRRYAKRQLTWFRRDERINWLYPDASENVLAQANELTQKFLKEE